MSDVKSKHEGYVKNTPQSQYKDKSLEKKQIKMNFRFHRVCEQITELSVEKKSVKEACHGEQEHGFFGWGKNLACLMWTVRWISM